MEREEDAHLLYFLHFFPPSFSSPAGKMEMPLCLSFACVISSISSALLRFPYAEKNKCPFACHLDGSLPTFLSSLFSFQCNEARCRPHYFQHFFPPFFASPAGKIQMSLCHSDGLFPQFLPSLLRLPCRKNRIPFFKVILTGES